MQHGIGKSCTRSENYTVLILTLSKRAVIVYSHIWQTCISWQTCTLHHSTSNQSYHDRRAYYDRLLRFTTAQRNTMQLLSVLKFH